MLDATSADSTRPFFNGAGHTGTWQPVTLSELHPAFVEAFNALYRRRPSRHVQLAGRSLAFAPVWRTKLPSVLDAWTLTFDVGGEPAELIVPQMLVDILFAELEASIDREDLSADTQALLLEFVLTEALETVETMLGSSVSILSAHKGLATWIGYDYPVLAIETELEGAAKSWSILRLSQQHLLRLARDFEKLPAAPTAVAMPDLPLPVSLRLASVDLSLAEIQSLRPGDIVLLDNHCPELETAMAVFSESLVAEVKILPNGYQLLDLAKPAKGSALDWCIDPPAAWIGPLSEAGATEVPMRLFIELGRFELSLAKLADLSRGAQIGANAQPGAHLDLMAGGTLIGHGELTAVGDSYGVRIVRA